MGDIVDTLDRLSRLDGTWYADVGRKTAAEVCAAMSDAKNEITRLRALTQWQPIKDMPKAFYADGTIFDLWWNGCRRPNCKWLQEREKAWWLDIDRDDWIDLAGYPAYYRLPPAPPEGEA